MKKGFEVNVKKKEKRSKQVPVRIAHRREITQREREVLKLIARGFRNREAAEKLGISTKTVETHRANIMNKLALRNTAELIHYAVREKLISIETD
ncbi:MAG TPA: response regulator transcription factor [Nitrososphaera sp.]|nr:response regulator transcription factor [Nitrososphaera sp.]